MCSCFKPTKFIWVDFVGTLVSHVTSLRFQKDLCFSKSKKKKKEKVILTVEELTLCVTYENVAFKSLCKMWFF